MGASGQGQMTKLVNQVIGATTLAAVAEGLTLAAHARPRPGGRARGGRQRRGDVVAARRTSARASSAATGRRASWCACSRRTCASRSRAAARVGVALPATAVVHQLFAAVEARGGGALGTQALAQALEVLAGRRPES